MNLEEIIETTLTQIQTVMNTNSIIGNAISTKDKVIIPVSKAALGFGVGMGENKSETGVTAGGAGGGGSIDPVAFVIIYNNIPGPDGVEILTLDGNSPLEEVLSSVGKTVFDLISSGSSNQQVKEDAVGTIDKIKTKIKSSDEE